MKQKFKINIGEKIKKLRKEQGMTIAVLAKKSGLSSGLISQIERNIVVPSVITLWRISSALDKNVSHFFNEEINTDIDIVVRKNSHRKIYIDSMNAIYELLTPNPNRKIEVHKVTIKGEVSSINDLRAHEGEECGYVIKGTLMVKMPDKEYILNEGDSIEFDSTIPHRYINVGGRECVSIWAMKAHSW